MLFRSIEAEVPVSSGRVDAVLELGDKIYIMEFKYAECPTGASPEAKRGLFEKTLDDGMAQIKEKGYAKKYAASGKTAYQAALAFLGRDEIDMRVEEAAFETV